MGSYALMQLVMSSYVIILKLKEYRLINSTFRRASKKDFVRFIHSINHDEKLNIEKGGSQSQSTQKFRGHFLKSLTDNARIVHRHKAHSFFFPNNKNNNNCAVVFS